MNPYTADTRHRSFRDIRGQLERSMAAAEEAPHRHRSYPDNTLEPSEELLERRRAYRKRVALGGNSARHTRSTLGENLFLLIMLMAAGYGLYRFCITILN